MQRSPVVRGDEPEVAAEAGAEQAATMPMMATQEGREDDAVLDVERVGRRRTSSSRHEHDDDDDLERSCGSLATSGR